MSIKQTKEPTPAAWNIFTSFEEVSQPGMCPECAARRRRQKAWFDAGWILLALIGFGFSIPYLLLFVSGGYSSLNF